MDKPTKILLCGIVFGGIIASGQIFYNRSLQNKLNQIKVECIAEGKETPGMICDPEKLEGTKVKEQGIQSKLLSAYRDLRQEEFRGRFVLVAIVVIGGVVLPWMDRFRN
jgi:hypothetical protein